MDRRISIAAVISVAAGSFIGAEAAPSIQFLPIGFLITDFSYDGLVACGNVQGDGSYETFRWTPAGGPVRLGRATVPVIGTGAGTPDISFDGTRISATIISSDVNATQGIWDIDTGWVETMPPMPADGANIDNSYGSAWGLSGDGATVTGFYWAQGGGTHGSTWSQSGGMVALQQIGRAVRVNAANTDGSVLTGWEERADGAWQPTAWRDGVRMRLVESEAPAQGYDVIGDGSLIVGDSYDPSIVTRVATVWQWDGAAYQTQRLGTLPGTPLINGSSHLTSVANDGSIAVGGNFYSFSPGGPRDGIVWRPGMALVSDDAFLASLGLSSQIPAGLEVIDLNAVSPDGQAIAGIGIRTAAPFGYQTFIVRLTPPCPGDANGDGVVGFADLNIVLSQYGQTALPASLAGDVNHDGAVDFADLNIVLGAFGTSC